MEECVIIVDNSNVWIEGKKFSAREKGIKTGDDPSWRIDFGKLLSTVAEKRMIRKAVLVGSRPPKEDYVIVHDRNAVGKEKAVDTEIVARGTEIICTTSPCVLKLLSGDRDFIPLIRIATNRGWETEMWAFTNAFKENGEMAQTVTRIKPLDHVFNEIGRYEFEWPIIDLH